MDITKALEEYSAQGFNKDQLYEIRKGLEAGYDVSQYANIGLSATEMNKIRKNITKKTNPTFLQRPIGKIILAVLAVLLIVEVVYIATHGSLG